MGLWHGQVILPTSTGDPDDTVTNSWHFQTAADTEPSVQDLSTTLGVFYSAIRGLYANAVTFTSAHVKWYLMSDPKPRPPRFDHPLLATGTNGGVAGPTQVAICMSFQGRRTPGLPQSRRRNRIFIGPLLGAAMVGPHIRASEYNVVIGAAATLLSSSNAAPWDWVVWSDTTAEEIPQRAQAWEAVVGGWVDDSWDIIRRRKLAATARTLFGVPAFLTNEPGPLPTSPPNA